MYLDKRAQACIDINEELANLSIEKSKRSVYRTHDHLRNVNGKAFEPEIIAIGPHHRDKDNTKMMEEHKLLYLHSLLERKKENVEKYVSAIWEMEAHKCYAEDIISVSPAKFTEMMVLDGCFIIELVRKCSIKGLREKNDPIFNRDWMMNSLLRDLMLFENQIPFSVLCKLFDLIEIPGNHERLIHLLMRFFSSIFPGAGCKLSVNKSPAEIKHLLELIHISWRPSLEQLGWRPSLEQLGLDAEQLGLDADTNDEKKRWRFIYSVTKLRDVNIKFERNERAESLFDVKFKNGVMSLPTLTIEDKTESFLRNLIAYEQYFPDPECNFITDYVKFLDCLIDSPRDVDILCHRGILINWLGDEEGVSNIFRKLTDSVTGPGKHFIYAKLFESVNNHCSKRRNSWIAMLMGKHLNSPWAIISVIAAVVLLLLTVVQTVCSILQVK